MSDGGDLEENGHFQARKCLVPCRKIIHKIISYYNSFIKGYPFIKGGGDLEENDHFH